MNEVFDFQNLIERMGKREEKAFEEFYERFGKLMYAIAVPRTTSKFDAEEVVDDALTKVWRMAPKLKVENINPAGWIATLVKRIAIDKYRRNQRMSTDELFIMPYYDKEIDRIIDNDTFMYLIDPLNEREKGFSYTKTWKTTHSMKLRKSSAFLPARFRVRITERWRKSNKEPRILKNIKI